MNIHVVPFNDGAGGTVTPLAGASLPGVAEYYPAVSADDTLIAFNRVATIDAADMYYRKEGEINGVIPGRRQLAPRAWPPTTRPHAAAKRAPACSTAGPSGHPTVMLAGLEGHEGTGALYVLARPRPPTKRAHRIRSHACPWCLPSPG